LDEHPFELIKSQPLIWNLKFKNSRGDLKDFRLVNDDDFKRDVQDYEDNLG